MVSPTMFLDPCFSSSSSHIRGLKDRSDTPSGGLIRLRWRCAAGSSVFRPGGRRRRDAVGHRVVNAQPGPDRRRGAHDFTFQPVSELHRLDLVGPSQVRKQRVGMDHIKQAVLNDAERRKALHQRLLFSLSFEQDPWQEQLSKPQLKKEFDRIAVKQLENA